MSSVFSKPKPPKAPEPPPPVEDVSDETEAARRRRERLRRGLSATILAPVGENLPDLQTKTLFGVS